MRQAAAVTAVKPCGAQRGGGGEGRQGRGVTGRGERRREGEGGGGRGDAALMSVQDQHQLHVLLLADVGCVR